MKKKLLLIVIDALANRVVEPALARGALPTMARLIERGSFAPHCTSIFPSITPAATAAIITGCYPNATGIVGAHFYDASKKRLYYFGDDIWMAFEQGFERFFRDFIVRMNDDLLDCKTLYEHAEEGGVVGACLNYLWYRGSHEHRTKVPLLLRLVPGVPKALTLHGPKVLHLGGLISKNQRGEDDALDAPGGPLHRFGFDDDATGTALLDLARSEGLPPLTVAYFPDNDFKSHEVGPQEALEAVQHVDEMLGAFLDACGGLDRFLETTAILITGDHAQCELHGEDSEIRLAALLPGFDVEDAADRVHHENALLSCLNMRAAQLYLGAEDRPKIPELVALLLSGRGVDQVIWRSTPDSRPDTIYHVATADRGQLSFAPAGTPGLQGAREGVDAYGGRWLFRGNLAAVDGEDAGGALRFSGYPNAFERIFCSFSPGVSGDLWVTSLPGYEFSSERIGGHRKGSHGALHVEDSDSVLIAAGLPEGVALPSAPRSVDVAPLALSVLGLRSPWALGESRVVLPSAETAARTTRTVS